MKYWVYMPLWNDADLVRMVLKYYETAERIIFYDAGSTDDGPDIIRAAGREVRHLEKSDRLCDKINIEMKNHAWKESKGHVDYVIVSDTDELIFFPRYPNDVIGALSEWKRNEVTHSFVTSVAIIMKDQEFSQALSRLSIDQHPTLSIDRGSREDPILTFMSKDPYMYDKPLIFDPNAIIETNFKPGQHYWDPQFNKPEKPAANRPLMLHCRYMGKTREFNRTQSTRERIKHQFNLGHGIQYNLTDTQILERTNWIYNRGIPIELFHEFKRVIPFIGAKDFLCCTHNEKDYISRQIASGKTWEPTVAAAIALLCNDDTLFVDIGANIGLHSFTAAICGAKVISFEAHPLTCKLLERSISVNGWQNKITIKEVACSDNDGNYINLIDDPTNMGGSSFEVAGKGTSYSVITTQVDSENIISISASNIVIKIDVEGHEEFVIKGMRKTLRDNRVTAVIVEFNPIIKSVETLMNNVYDPLVSLGFSDIRILLQHPSDNWEGDAIFPAIPESISEIKTIVLDLLSKGAVVELLFLRNYK